MSLIKKIIIGFVVVFVLIQFFPIDKTNPPVDATVNMINLVDTSPEMQQVLKSACYDCHSYETEYPWYSNIAPVSWWIKDHVNEGREELNFSTWGSYSLKRQDHKLEEMGEEVDESEMPLTSYTLTHSHARLNDSQRQALVSWAKAVREKLGYDRAGDDEGEEHEE